MERAAATSDFGSNVFLEGAVGIWQITEDNFDTAQQITNRHNFSLTFPFIELTFSDMSDPNHNALAALILIQVQIRNLSLQRKNSKSIGITVFALISV